MRLPAVGLPVEVSQTGQAALLLQRKHEPRRLKQVGRLNQRPNSKAGQRYLLPAAVWIQGEGCLFPNVGVLSSSSSPPFPLQHQQWQRAVCLQGWEISAALAAFILVSCSKRREGQGSRKGQGVTAAKEKTSTSQLPDGKEASPLPLCPPGNSLRKNSLTIVFPPFFCLSAFAKLLVGSGMKTFSNSLSMCRKIF